MRARVPGSTSGRSLRALETVVFVTPAWRAMLSMVTPRLFGRVASTLSVTVPVIDSGIDCGERTAVADRCQVVLDPPYPIRATPPASRCTFTAANGPSPEVESG